jgi:hypothetical protein
MSSIYTPFVSGAFVPLGNTVTFLANTQAPTPVQAVQSSANNVSFCQYRIFNSGTNLVFLGWGSNTTIANNNAIVVTTSASCLPVLPGTLEIVSLPSNTYITAITASGTSQIYVTPGVGV